MYVQMLQDWLAYQPGLHNVIRRDQRKGAAVPRCVCKAHAYSAKAAAAQAATQHVASSKLLISLDFLIADVLMKKGRIRLYELRAAWTTAMVGTEPGAKASWMYFPVHCVTHTPPHTHTAFLSWVTAFLPKVTLHR